MVLEENKAREGRKVERRAGGEFGVWGLGGDIEPVCVCESESVCIASVSVSLLVFLCYLPYCRRGPFLCRTY